MNRGAVSVVIILLTSSCSSTPTASPSPTVMPTATVAASPIRQSLAGPPRNGWIAFSTQAGWPEVGHDYIGSGGDIYLVRDGIEARMIVSRGTRNTSNVCPAFSPDGSKLVYGTRDGSDRALVLLVVSADGVASESGRLDVPGEGTVPCPRWSADGMRLAYLDGDSPEHTKPSQQPGSVVVRGLDGSTLTPAAGDPSTEDLRRSLFDSPPLASPPGDWVVVLTADPRVVIQRPDGSEARTVVGLEGLTPIANSPDYAAPPYAIPAWSPDGKYILAMVDVGSWNFAVVEISVESPFEMTVLVPNLDVNSASGSSFPGRGDASWQAVTSQ